MKIEILDEAQEDLLQGFRFTKTENRCWVVTSWIPCSRISILFFYTQEFTQLSSAITVVSRSASRSPFTTQWLEKWFVYMLSWIVAEVHHGLETA